MLMKIIIRCSIVRGEQEESYPRKQPMYIYFPRAVCELNRMIFYIIYIYRIFSCFVRNTMGVIREECHPFNDHAEEIQTEPKCFEESMRCFPSKKRFVVKRPRPSFSRKRSSVHVSSSCLQFREMASRNSILISIHCGRLFIFFLSFILPLLFIVILFVSFVFMKCCYNWL